jgi:hypothetical protein
MLTDALIRGRWRAHIRQRVRAVLIEIGRAAARVAVFSLAKSLNQADRSLKNSVISPVFRSITVAV